MFRHLLHGLEVELRVEQRQLHLLAHRGHVSLVEQKLGGAAPAREPSRSRSRLPKVQNRPNASTLRCPSNFREADIMADKPKEPITGVPATLVTEITSCSNTADGRHALLQAAALDALAIDFE